jgi:hypothetical protein
LFTVVRYIEQFRALWAGRGAGGEFLASGARVSIAKALMRGIFAGITGVPRMLLKRRRIMRAKKISQRDLAHLLRRHRISFRELLGNG